MSRVRVLCVYNAAETDCGGAVSSGGHQQQLSMLRQLCRVWKIPLRTLRMVITAAPDDSSTRMFVMIFIGPLPNVSDHVHDAKRAGALRKCVYVGRRSEVPALIGRRNSARHPFIPPRIKPTIGTLGGVLPFPLVRETFASPTRISPSVFQ